MVVWKERVEHSGIVCVQGRLTMSGWIGEGVPPLCPSCGWESSWDVPLPFSTGRVTMFERAMPVSLWFFGSRPWNGILSPLASFVTLGCGRGMYGTYTPLRLG